MGAPTFFIDDVEVAARLLEVPDATWADGCNNSASNACGIGINHGEGAISGEAQQFTLLDQNGAARNPQVSGHIGLQFSQAVRKGDPVETGAVVNVANVALTDLTAGWVNGV